MNNANAAVNTATLKIEKNPKVAVNACLVISRQIG